MHVIQKLIIVDIHKIRILYLEKISERNSSLTIPSQRKYVTLYIKNIFHISNIFHKKNIL